jgi:hypothetical protein
MKSRDIERIVSRFVESPTFEAQSPGLLWREIA